MNGSNYMNQFNKQQLIINSGNDPMEILEQKTWNNDQPPNNHTSNALIHVIHCGQALWGTEFTPPEVCYQKKNLVFYLGFLLSIRARP